MKINVESDIHYFEILLFTFFDDEFRKRVNPTYLEISNLLTYSETNFQKLRILDV